MINILLNKSIDNKIKKMEKIFIELKIIND